MPQAEKIAVDLGRSGSERTGGGRAGAGTMKETMSMSDKGILDRLSPRQREAVTYVDGPLLILAGAGSGKTRVQIGRAHV